MDDVSIIVAPIVNTLVEDTTKMIKKKIHLIKGVEKDIEQLQSKLSAILSVLEDAEAKQLDSKPVRDWLGKLEDAAYDAKDVLDTYETNAMLWQKNQQVRKVRLPFSASKTSYKLNTASQIKDILARINEIEKEKDGLHLDVSVGVVGPNNGTSENRRITTSLVYEPDIVGREDDKDKIINLLMSEEYNREGGVAVIPIIGMGGLGKTTLAQIVYNDDRVKSHFEFRMWVCVTMNYDYKRILKEMIESHSKMKYDTNSISLNQ
ncbi:disease resistance protein RGA2-like [Cornus florida]|uniref:disease resistance protein RGA2-like n=1 Tax=Cornus florida TaxID=4283 RepID=UPI0028A13C88|nr:disease resistance protein RGA2-like [Cornus florida]